MIFLKGLWHGLKVLATAGYWLLSLYFVWAALILMGRDWRVALALVALVAGLFVARIGVGRRLKSPGAAYVAAFVIYMAVFVVMYLVDPARRTGG